MVPETESRPSQEYVESLQQLKDALSKLESEQHSIASGLSEPSRVEKALQQAKVTLTFVLKEGRKLLHCCHPLFSCCVFSGVANTAQSDVRDRAVEPTFGGGSLGYQAAEGHVQARAGYLLSSLQDFTASLAACARR